MKKSLLLILITLALVLPTFAAPPTTKAAAMESNTTATPKMGVEFDVLGVLVDYFSGSFEMGITKSISGKIFVEYSPNLVWASGVSVFGAQVEGRYYFSRLISGAPDWLRGDAIKGLFAGIGAGFYSMKWDYGIPGFTYNASLFSPDAFLEVGTKFFLSDHFYIDGALGFDILFSSNWTFKDSSGNTVTGLTATPTAAAGGFRYVATIGYAF